MLDLDNVIESFESLTAVVYIRNISPDLTNWFMTSAVSSSITTIRIGSRKSQLALIQTYWVKEELSKKFPNIKFEVHTMSTKGDKILDRSEEHTSELQSPCNLVCRLLLEKKKKLTNFQLLQSHNT